MEAELLHKTSDGGNFIRVHVPVKIFDLCRDIQKRIAEGESEREGDGKREWEAKIWPHVKKALGDYKLDPIRDIVWIRPRERKSTSIAVPNRKVRRAQLRFTGEPRALLRGKGK